MTQCPSLLATELGDGPLSGELGDGPLSGELGDGPLSGELDDGDGLIPEKNLF